MQYALCFVCFFITKQTIYINEKITIIQQL